MRQSLESHVEIAKRFNAAVVHAKINQEQCSDRTARATTANSITSSQTLISPLAQTA